MEDYQLSYLSFFFYFQVNSSLVLDFSSFIHDICEDDYTSNFTTSEIFPTREDLVN